MHNLLLGKLRKRTMIEQTVGFIGAGQMARALARGFVEKHRVAAASISAYDPHQTALDEFTQLIPAATRHDSNQALMAAADIIFLAVKPQYVEDVIQGLKRNLSAGKLIVSIVAGVTCEHLSKGFRTDHVIRAMPNTPALVGSGACGYCRGSSASEADAALVGELLCSVGVAFELPERLLDAVTGLSGSGPAFVFQFIEALADGGVRVGLPRDVALQLALHTVRGAADLAISLDQHPAVLKDRVASPGGTTIEGLHALESGRLRATTMNAVVAATQRSAALGRETSHRSADNC
jgi:pyrroline-5-carboxylate reductase